MDKTYGKCAKCPFNPADRICKGYGDKHPVYCSTTLYPEIIDKANEEYLSDPALMKFAYNASCQEADCYRYSSIDPSKLQPEKCRIQEIIEFCQKMEYKKLGLAFCGALAKEAMSLNKILESHNFQVVSVMCKVGCTDKSVLGIGADEKIWKRDAHESMCNPIAQAKILNEENCDFNLLLGLCVGHDSMFIKYSNAPITIVAVKDRLLGHSPLSALYSSYYSFLENPAK